MAILTTEVKTKINNYKDEFLTLYPNNEMLEVEGEEAPKYTDTQWLDEVVKNFLISGIKRGRAILHKRTLEEADVTLE